MIRLIKIIHTIVWAVMVSAILYIFYCGWTNNFNLLLWLSIALILGEGVVLIFNDWHCPFTDVAKKYTDDRQDNLDIYLPNFIAKYNRLIFTIIFFVGIILVIF